MNAPMPYRLGLPLWAHAGWKGRLFDASPSMLASYASVFNTVEGNTSFYAIPEPATVAGWRRALDGSDCRICFKLPRSVTHDARPALDDLERFLASIDELGQHRGPCLVQFSEHVGPREIERFEPVFERVASAGKAVVEVRHPAFFEQPASLVPILARYRFGRVMLDTRPLYQGDRLHPDVVSARHRKPDLPLLDEVHAGLAFVRLVLHPDGVSNELWIDDWVERAATMIDRGDELYLMIHCPDNDHCPAFAARFHARLCRRLGAERLPPLPSWPIPRQDDLF